MDKLMVALLHLICGDLAQDMVEYALLAGFIAVAAAAALPPISSSISQIFSKMASVTAVAAANCSDSSSPAGDASPPASVEPSGGASCPVASSEPAVGTCRPRS